MDKYLKALKQNVCSICVDSSEKGACTLNDKETCAVELYFPQIIDVVHKTKAEKLFDLQKELRETICTQCRAQEAGNCYLREDANCSLDRYFPLIVEIIRKVDAGKL
jgi:hypothetical protein